MLRNSWTIITTTCGIFLLCASATPASAQLVSQVQIREHVVQRGEYPASIAKKYGITPAQLLKLNPGCNAKGLHTGDRLIVGKSTIPAANATAKPSARSAPAAQAKPKAASPLPAPAVGKSKRPDKIAMLEQTESAAKQSEKKEPGMIKTGFLFIIKLVFVLALAYGTMLVLKLLSNKQSGLTTSSGKMKVVETVKLSPTNNLHLVEIGGQKLLLGSSGGQVSLLKELEPEMVEEIPQDRDSKFADYLMKYSQETPQATPAKRIAGLLRDCSTYLKNRQQGINSLRSTKKDDKA